MQCESSHPVHSSRRRIERGRWHTGHFSVVNLRLPHQLSILLIARRIIELMGSSQEIVFKPCPRMIRGIASWIMRSL
ncbi:hypothetical protein A9R05_39350 (plasmid) [Burkholderia sp. KK1]|nr:hypothetical protein A9R05_39350 [Burkholderia sp. KK1]